MDYDGAGNLKWSASGHIDLLSPTDCNNAEGYWWGRRVDRSYDARNRLTALTFPDGRGNQSWAYTPDGLPTSITTYNDPSNGSPVINAYTYNKRRMLIGESVAQPGWYSWGLGYSYDPNGNMRWQSYPTGLVLDYAPNALGQPTQVSDQSTYAYATGVQYYPNGAIKQFTYGNGIVHTMLQNTRQLPQRSTDSGGALDLAYSFDANANVNHIWDYAQDTGNGFYGRWMTYDGLDRLTDAGSCSFGGDCWHRFTYDALDNLKSWKLPGVKDYAEYVYTNNRLTNIKNTAGATVVGLDYDLQGNLFNKNGQAYGFDYGNRLRDVPGKESYRYDGLGRRVLNWRPADNTTTLSQYSQSGQVLYNENTKTLLKTEHIYLGGSLLANRETIWGTSTVTAKYQHTDALGSPVAVTNMAGTVIDRTHYEPYGAAINKPAYDGIGYTGHVMDGATGLTYMQQRYYDPDSGRFLSVDPVAANSASFNRYNYGNNNPYRFIDPDGRNFRDWLRELLGGRGDDPDAARSRMSELAHDELMNEVNGVKEEAQDMAAVVVKYSPEATVDTSAKAHLLIFGVSYENGNELNWTPNGIKACSTGSQCMLLGPGAYAGGSVTPTIAVGDMTSQDYYFGVVVEGGAVENASGEVNFNSAGGSLSAGGGGGGGGVVAFKVCQVVMRSSGCN